MIRTRHYQPSLWTGVLAEEVDDLWEPWMRRADRLLDDEQLIERVFEAQARRWLKSRTRGRRQTPAEVVLRLLILKHVRNWSYEVLEREVRANLVYRTFARIGAEKVPDAKTLGRLGQVVGPDVVADLHRRLVEMAMENKVVVRAAYARGHHGRGNQHPLSDRQQFAGRWSASVDPRDEEIGASRWRLSSRVRDRMRTVRKKVLAIALAARQKGAAGEEKRRHIYKGLLSVTRKIVHQAKRVIGEVDQLGERKRKDSLRAAHPTGDDGRSSRAGSEANAGADFRRQYEIRRQDS